MLIHSFHCFQEVLYPLFLAIELSLPKRQLYFKLKCFFFVDNIDRDDESVLITYLNLMILYKLLEQIIDILKNEEPFELFLQI